VQSVSPFDGCRYVCIYESLDVKFIFGHPVYLEGIQFKFVYEGHQVKVKVTGANERKIPYSRNVKL